MNNPESGESGTGGTPAEPLVPAGAGASRNGRPRLDPKPLWKPPIDPLQAGAFGRPGGVGGSFAPHRSNGPVPLGAPPMPEYLEDAFGRPPGSHESLPRPPAAGADSQSADPPADPWSDPTAGARLGPPALPPDGAPSPVLPYPRNGSRSVRRCSIAGCGLLR